MSAKCADFCQQKPCLVFLSLFLRHIVSGESVFRLPIDIKVSVGGGVGVKKGEPPVAQVRSALNFVARYVTLAGLLWLGRIRQT